MINKSGLGTVPFFEIVIIINFHDNSTTGLRGAIGVSSGGTDHQN
jgi:hypothetical protein